MLASQKIIRTRINLGGWGLLGGLLGMPGSLQRASLVTGATSLFGTFLVSPTQIPFWLVTEAHTGKAIQLEGTLTICVCRHQICDEDRRCVFVEEWRHAALQCPDYGTLESAASKGHLENPIAS